MGSHPGFTTDSFAFLQELAANNERDWYKANRERHREALEDPFARLLGQATEILTAEGIELYGGKRTMFRIQRDTRFSKDKTPYKTTTSGMLTPSGDKKEMGGIVYAQIDAEGGFLGAGYYNLSPKALAPIRRRMIAEPEGLQQMLDHLRRHGRELSMDMALRTMPRGFESHKDSEVAPYVRLKSLLTSEKPGREAWLDGSIVERLVSMAREVQPLLAYGRVSG